MLNHASTVNSKRLDERSKKRAERDKKQQEQDAIDPVVMNGKRISELSSEEQMKYYMGEDDVFIQDKS